MENKKLEWITVKRNVRELIPYDYNPRQLTESRRLKLENSLKKFNLVEIPVINTDNVLLAGHQRVKVLIDLGRSDDIIDVRYPNRELTEIEIKEYNVTSNIPVGFWDLDILDEAFADIDLEALGLDVDSIVIPSEALNELGKLESEPEFNIKTSKHPVSILGDVYEFKSIDKNISHTVGCMSSTSQDNLKVVFKNKRANLIVTDPPYNVNYQGGTDEQLSIKNDDMSDLEFYTFLLEFYSSAFYYTEEGAPIYVFHADSEGANFRKALIDAKWKLAQCLIWVKNSIVMGRQDYQWKHEPILYGWKLGAAHTWMSDRKQSTVLYFDKPLRNADHPTMKPLDILKYLIENSSKRKSIVFDGFLGSGSTLIACELTKRNCIGTELDPIYCDVIIRRWHTYMTYNGLDFKIFRNNKELNDQEIEEYYKSVR